MSSCTGGALSAVSKCSANVQEITVLVQYIRQCKEDANDWFNIVPSTDGLKWHGKCWYVHDLLRYEFDFDFELPAMYPATAPEIRLPSLAGKTAKQYRGGVSRSCVPPYVATGTV